MAVLDARKVTKNLLKKGFELRESHHHYFEFWHEGKLIAKTRSSHNNQGINDYLIKSMASGCQMPKKFFIEFCKCTKNKEDYIELLLEKGDL